MLPQASSQVSPVIMVDRRRPRLLLGTVVSPWPTVAPRALEGMDEVNSPPTPSGPDHPKVKTSTTTAASAPAAQAVAPVIRDS